MGLPQADAAHHTSDRAPGIAWFLPLILAACSPAPPDAHRVPPADLVRDYRSSIRSGKCAQAYELLSSSDKAAVSRERFCEPVVDKLIALDDGWECAQQPDRPMIEQLDGGAAVVNIRFTCGGTPPQSVFGSYKLVKENGKWRISMDLGEQIACKDAINQASFRDANGDLDGALKIVQSELAAHPRSVSRYRDELRSYAEELLWLRSVADQLSVMVNPVGRKRRQVHGSRPNRVSVQVHNSSDTPVDAVFVVLHARSLSGEPLEFRASKRGQPCGGPNDRPPNLQPRSNWTIEVGLDEGAVDWDAEVRAAITGIITCEMRNK